MLFLSKEKDRLGWFYSDSSVRSNLDWNVFCDIEIELPSIEIQKKFSQIYIALRRFSAFSKKMSDICPVLIKGAIEEENKRNGEIKEF
jgi:type I restriction enzyme S subunit